MLKAAEDPREGRIIHCEARDCKAWINFGSKEWAKLWRRTWVEKLGINLFACSQHCSNEIKAGRYKEINKQEKPTTEPMKAEQVKLF